MTTINLKEHSVLVSITNHCFKPSLIHKGESAAVRSVNNTAKDAVKVLVSPIDKAFWAPMYNKQMEILRWRDSMTLPWSKGEVILPVTLMDEFTEGLRKKLDEFDEILNEQMKKYPDLVNAAPRDRMGKLHNPEHYPPAEVVRSRYAVEVEFSPVPDRDDFRLKCTEEQLTMLQDQNDKHIATMHKQMTANLYERLAKQVGACVKALHKDTKRVHESVFATIHEMVASEPKLNLSSDEGVHSRYQDARRILLTRTVESFRNDHTLREQVRDAAVVLLNSLPCNTGTQQPCTPVAQPPAPVVTPEPEPEPVLVTPEPEPEPEPEPVPVVTPEPEPVATPSLNEEESSLLKAMGF